MPLFLNEAVLKAAVANLKNASVQGRIFEYLTLKRTIVLAGQPNVVFAETGIGYKKAIEELALVGVFDGHESDSSSKFVNVFQQETQLNRGYKIARFTSNGPNSTISNQAWGQLVKIDATTRPRRISFTPGYEDKLATFLLDSTVAKPSLQAFSFWFYRHTDLETKLVEKSNSIEIAEELTVLTVAAFNFTSGEIAALFDDSSTFIEKFLDENGPDLFSEEITDAAKYLAPPVGRKQGRSATTVSAKGAARSKIVYGAPGTGKSFLLQQEAEQFDHHIRITFHPDYSFYQFVGGYKPKSQYLDEATKTYYDRNEKNANGDYTRRPVIDYVAVPGPFLSLLAQAYQHPDQQYLLIIEELNRANAAAVFGDLFQLLDRDGAGVSQYPATLPVELANWLLTEGVALQDPLLTQTEGGELALRLPENFYIWATMNSADQGVLPLDAAFKRRWAFEYVPLDKNADAVADWQVRLVGRMVSWDQLRRKLNQFLMRQASGGGRALVPEDRLLGPFFLKSSELADDSVVLNKLLLYLRDDLVRHNPTTLFATATQHFSELYEQYTKLSKLVVPATDDAGQFRQDLEKLFAAGLAAELAPLFSAATAPPTATPADE